MSCLVDELSRFSSHWGSTLKEQILSFKNEPSFGRDKLCREANKEQQKSFLIVEMEKKEHGDIHYTSTWLTKLKRRELVPFYPVLLFILAIEF